MDIQKYISSGILEQYCLNLVAPGERAEVERYAHEYPVISSEIAQIRVSLESYAIANGISPSQQVKTNLFLKTYQLESGSNKRYPPLVDEKINARPFLEWTRERSFTGPGAAYENLFILELPSTEVVSNYMIWAKTGLDEEEHHHFNEFVVILEGHCDMFMNGEKRHFEKGDIIHIPPHVPHYAVVTSPQPMIAIIQRQLIAA